MLTDIIIFEELPLFVGGNGFGFHDGECEVDANGTVCRVWLKNRMGRLVEIRDTPTTGQLLTMLANSIERHCEGLIIEAQARLWDAQAATAADRRIDALKHEAAE